MILNKQRRGTLRQSGLFSDAAIAAAPNPAQPNAIHMKEENHEP